MNLEKI